MKKIIYVFSIICCLIFTVSCSDDVNEVFENTEAIELLEEVNVKSLSDIDDSVFLAQFSQTREQLGGILSENYSQLLTEHNTDAISIDEDRIVVVQKSGGVRTYNFLMTIPHKFGQEELNMSSYVTLTFQNNLNAYNQLQIGFFEENSLEFDSEGTIINSFQVKYGGSSPSNKPSKAPKPVLCGWASRTGNLGLLNGYCGWTIGVCEGCPLPDFVLDLIPAENSARTSNDLVVPVRNAMDPSRTTYEIPFSSFTSSTYGIDASLRNDFNTFFYQDSQGQGYFLDYSTRSDAHLIHKQAFITSFQNWLYSVEDLAPNTFNILVSDYSILRSVFLMFANLHLGVDMEVGAYMQRVTYASYSPDPNFNCMGARESYFFTHQGFLQLQQLDWGAITWQQFEANMPSCN